MADNQALLDALNEVLDPIREKDRPLLRKKATELKQTDGEGWAIGEMTERACILLDALEYERAWG